ncbi:unnamed protein product [Effrenium voratum]|uniref:Uncharacterized protein n=1 Tax=Effrenium voratum TaxID=2562239 RepID=A0AA36NG64_9DINO|nr:unnamed protein product [Effrenium voratum]
MALGRNMKRLRHCSNLASALSDDFWDFVKNLLGTWSQLAEAFARQALLIDCSDKRLTLLFQSLDHASAAIVYTLLSLDKHLDDAAGKPEGAGKGGQHAMEYLRRLQACEESFACKLFPNAQMQFPRVVLEYKHQFQLLKTTDLAEKYNKDMWGPDKTSYWVTGALAFVPEHRLSQDRKFLAQDYMSRIPKLGEEKFKRVKWDSVVLVELDWLAAAAEGLRR